MGVCSTSGPLHAVPQAPTALEGARGDARTLLPPFAVALLCGFGTPDQQKSSLTEVLTALSNACVDAFETWRFSGLLTCGNILTPTQACSAL